MCVCVCVCVCVYMCLGVCMYLRVNAYTYGCITTIIHFSSYNISQNNAYINNVCYNFYIMLVNYITSDFLRLSM